MDIDIEKLVKTAVENLNLEGFKGDVVGVKIVENEIGNVEAGGIAVQNVYTTTPPKTTARPVADADGEAKLPPELSTPEAIALLEKARQAGYLDEQYQPVGLSRAKQAILANTIAETLGIERKWKVFEELWGYSRFSTAYQESFVQKNISNFIQEVERVIDNESNPSRP